MLARRLSAGSTSATGQQTIKEPTIVLTQEDKGGIKEAGIALPVSVPLSHYMDTRGAVLELQTAGMVSVFVVCRECCILLLLGYSAEQADVLVKVLTQSLQNAVSPVEKCVLSQRDLVGSFHMVCSIKRLSQAVEEILGLCLCKYQSV